MIVTNYIDINRLEELPPELAVFLRQEIGSKGSWIEAEHTKNLEAEVLWKEVKQNEID